MRGQHTTFRYRGMGIDLVYGVLVNVFAAILSAVFHTLHHLILRPPIAVNADVFCLVAAIAVATLALAIFSIRGARRCNPDGTTDEFPADYVVADEKTNWLNANGIAFMLVMLAQTALMAWVASLLEVSSVARYLQVSLFIAFWTTAFTYLPILGLFRTAYLYRKSTDPRKNLWTDGVRVYFQKYGHFFVFPGAVLLHAVVIAGLMGLGFRALVAPDVDFMTAVRDVALQIAGGGLMLGFFSALPLHRRYERLIFGRNILPDPEVVRKRYTTKVLRQIEEEAREAAADGSLSGSNFDSPKNSDK